MHPAPSIVVFTVLSGAGFGLGAWLAAGAGPGGGWGRAALALAIGLAAAGLLASAGHLARPSRAWRAFSQWRSSWLSREAVLAAAALGALACHLLLGAPGGAPLGFLAAALCVATLLATAMIYAQLRAVPAWATPMTPALFLLFGLATGGVLATLLRALAGAEWRPAGAVALLLLGAGWTVKLLWWRRSARLASATPGQATGLGDRVRAFEPPHTGTNYLLEEMAFRIGRRRAAALRRLAIFAGGALPGLALAAALVAPVAAVPLLALATPTLLLGLLAERWLFFAEARHVQAGFYGERAPAAASPPRTAPR